MAKARAASSSHWAPSPRPAVSTMRRRMVPSQSIRVTTTLTRPVCRPTHSGPRSPEGLGQSTPPGELEDRELGLAAPAVRTRDLQTVTRRDGSYPVRQAPRSRRTAFEPPQVSDLPWLRSIETGQQRTERVGREAILDIVL